MMPATLSDIYRIRKTKMSTVSFRNHIDPWCIKNCDPLKVEEFDGVNTPVCEHMFTKIN